MHTSFFFFVCLAFFFGYLRKEFCDSFLPLSFIRYCSNGFVYFIWDIYYKFNQIDNCFVFFCLLSVYNYLRTKSQQAALINKIIN